MKSAWPGFESVLHYGCKIDVTVADFAHKLSMVSIGTSFLGCFLILLHTTIVYG